jgi:DNA-binding GntR family transcriptional regulator
MSTGKLSTKTLRQQIYDQLKRKIISADILPGHVVTIQGLANEFGVSMMPVREALWQLESEKVIVIESNKCIHVNTLKRVDLNEVLELRLVLESMAAEKACVKITDSGLSKLKRILETMETGMDRPKKGLLLNSQFHFTIYSYADSSLLLGMIDSLWARIGPYMTIGWEKAGDHTFILRSHQNIYQALVERNKEKLKEWLCEDLTHGTQTIMPFLEDSTSDSGQHLRRGITQKRGTTQKKI